MSRILFTKIHLDGTKHEQLAVICMLHAGLSADEKKWKKQKHAQLIFLNQQNEEKLRQRGSVSDKGS